jgi:hypothetical protein
MRTPLLIALFAILFVNGCDDSLQHVTTAPDASAKAKGNASNGPPPGHVLACERREAKVGSGIFGPPGGVLRVGNNELIIPGGALKGWIEIRGEVPNDTIASIRLFPEGLQFRKAAGLVLDTQGCAEPPGQAKILYLHDDGTILEDIEAHYSPKWKRVAAPITHFSRYALGV